MKKKNRKRSIMLIFGTVFTAYGLFILVSLGFNYFFNYFFLLWGLVLILTALYGDEILSKARKAAICLKLLTRLFLMIFIIFEIVIICFGFSRPRNNASAIIVLGSGVNRDGKLSRDFAARLNKALEYYLDHQDASIIVTGKQGLNEPVAEAVAGKAYLVSKGVKENKILVDDQSKDTYENLFNAYKLCDHKKDVLIVSSCFHLFRANYIASKLGFEKVECLGSIGAPVYLPQYFAREFFGFVKDFVLLN